MAIVLAHSAEPSLRGSTSIDSHGWGAALGGKPAYSIRLGNDPSPRQSRRSEPAPQA
jgi:hypothetical protein